MSDILCRWLNEEVNVSKHVDRRSFSGAFASGLLFGEVLHKHGLLKEEFPKFLPGTSSEAKLRNFKLLLPTLRLLAIPMKANTAHDIMIGKAGVAQDVVYQLYSALSHFDKQAFEQRKLDTRKTRRESIDEVFYDRLLTGKTPRQTDLNMLAFEAELEAKRAATEEKIRERDAKAQARLDQQTREQMRLMHERSQLKKKQYDERIAAMEAQYHARAAAFGVDPTKKRSMSVTKTPPTTSGSTLDLRNLPDRPVSRERLQPLDLTGVSAPSSRQSLRPSSMGTATSSRPQTLNTNTATKTLPASGPSTASTTGSSNTVAGSGGLVGTIRSRKQEMDVARVERGKRRQRALVREAKLRSEHDAQERHSLLLSKLLRTSQEERRIAVALTNRRDEERVIRENRMFRDRQRKERLRKDFEEALQREAELARQQNEENADEIQRRAARMRKIAENRASEEQAANRRFVTSLVDQLVDLSTKCGEAREVGEGKLSAAQYREWKALVLQGVPLYASAVESPDVLPTPDDVLNDLDYHNYVHLNEPWRSLRDSDAGTADDTRGTNRESVPDGEYGTGGTGRTSGACDASDASDTSVPQTPATTVDGAGVDAPIRTPSTADGISSAVKAMISATDEESAIGTDFAPGMGHRPDTPPEQKVNRVLGHVVHRIHTAAHPPPRVPLIPHVPPSRVRAAVIGKPFSGRTKAVRAACARLGAEVVSPTELIQEAIAAHTTSETVKQYCNAYGLSLPDSPGAASAGDKTDDNTNDTVHTTGDGHQGMAVLGSTEDVFQGEREAGVETPAVAEDAATADAAGEQATVSGDASAGSAATEAVPDIPKSGADADPAIATAADATKSDANTAPSTATSDGTAGEADIAQSPDMDYHVLDLQQCPSERAVLGQRAHEHMQRGEAVPSEVVVGLVVLAVQRIDPTKGWVLDNFPTTREDCVLFEKVLTGYDEAQPDPYAHMSSLAPVSADERISPHVEHKSALAAVVCLDVDDTTCIRRAEGRRLDPDTGVVYHLEGLGFPPPPRVPAPADVPADVTTADDVLGLRDRLVPVQDVYASRAHLHDVLDRWAQNSPAVAAWYAQWDVYLVVNASTYNDELATALHHTLVDVSQTEEREAEAAAAAMARADREAQELLAQADADVAEQDTIEHDLATELADDAAALARTADEARLAAEAEERAASAKGKKKKPKSAKKGKGGAAEEMPEGADLEALIQREQEEAAQHAAKEAVPAVPGAPGYAYHSDQQFLDVQLALALDALWQHTEASYEDSLKLSFAEMRALRDTLAHYLHDHRVEFAEFLTRPDTKQEYVSLWQQAYNAVPLDMRGDPDTKAELHMRAHDLYDTLMDICDKRREEAEADLHVVRTSGFAEDHMGMLANLYTNAIKAEVDRYCDTNTLLGDFYAAAMEKCISDAPVDAPPLQVLPTTAGQTAPRDVNVDTADTVSALPATENVSGDGTMPGISAGGNEDTSVMESAGSDAEKVPAGDAEATGNDNGGNNALATGAPGDGAGGAAGDAACANENGTTAILDGVDSTVVSVITSDGPLTLQAIKKCITAAAEKAQSLVVERRDPKEVREEEAAAEAAAKEKEEKAKKKPKKGEVVEEPLPPTVEEMQALEQAAAKRDLLAMIDDERHVAFVVEDGRFKARVELLRKAALRAIEESWSRNVTLWDHITTCTTLRYNTEIAAIKTLKQTAQQAIEAEEKLSHELILDADTFVVDKHVFMYAPPQPDPDAPPLAEVPDLPTSFTVAQLTRLSDEFEHVCPDFSIPTTTLARLVHGLCAVASGNSLVPVAWQQLAFASVRGAVEAVAMGVEVDWRQFVVAALRIPPPTTAQLLEALHQLRKAANEHGDIDEATFMHVPMWFDDTPTEGTNGTRVFHRGRAMKQLLSKLLGVNGTVAVFDICKWLCRMPHPRDALLAALALHRTTGGESVGAPGRDGADSGSTVLTVDEACSVLCVDASNVPPHPPRLPAREFLFPLWAGQPTIAVDALLSNSDVAAWVEKFFGVAKFATPTVVVAGSAATSSVA